MIAIVIATFAERWFAPQAWVIDRLERGIPHIHVGLNHSHPVLHVDAQRARDWFKHEVIER